MFWVSEPPWILLFAQWNRRHCLKRTGISSVNNLQPVTWSSLYRGLNLFHWNSSRHLPFRHGEIGVDMLPSILISRSSRFKVQSNYIGDCLPSDGWARAAWRHQSQLPALGHGFQPQGDGYVQQSGTEWVSAEITVFEVKVLLCDVVLL